MNFLVFLLIIIVFIQVVLLFLLRKSFKRHLYSYRNLGVTAGILASIFCFVGTFVAFISSETSKTGSEVLAMVVTFPVSFSSIAIPILAVINGVIIISNISLMKHEGKKLKNCLGLFIAIAFIGGTILIYASSYLLYNFVFIPAGLATNNIFHGAMIGVYVFLLNFVCYAECMYVAFLIVSIIISKVKPSYDKDFIIILGCSIAKDGCLLPLLKGRTNRAVKFAWEQEIATGKPVYYVPSGGQGADEVMSEGSAMELYLLSHGAESYEVFPEKESTNTYENFTKSKAIIQAINPNAKIAFATTNYHIYRSGILARRAGIEAEGIASDTTWYFWPNGLVREFVAIMKMNPKAHAYVAAVNLVWSIAMAVITAVLV